MPAETTPMMRQYIRMKELHPDCLLFFRLGDFYEMFNEDAKVASKELELTLTSRDRGKPADERTPMCGVPYHSADAYIARLIAKGYKVAICEQMEDPATAKGLVDRDIIRHRPPPGTLIDASMLEEGRNNYICAVYGRLHRRGPWRCAICPPASFSATPYTDAARSEHLFNDLGAYKPREAVSVRRGLCRRRPHRLPDQKAGVPLRKTAGRPGSAPIWPGRPCPAPLPICPARGTPPWSWPSRPPGACSPTSTRPRRTDLSHIAAPHRPLRRCPALHGAGPDRPAHPGADRDHAGQGEAGQPSLGAGQDQDRHGPPAHPHLAGAAPPLPCGHQPAAGRR